MFNFAKKILGPNNHVTAKTRRTIKGSRQKIQSFDQLNNHNHRELRTIDIDN